jgi:23S rRNA (guanosine2251-2'-O)-methyltransferase
MPLPPPAELGPDEELVAGRRPVEEAFVARRPAIRLLVVPQRRAALEKLVLHATNLRIPIVEVEGGSLTALAGFDGHQGIALIVEPRRYAGLDDVLARAAERGEPPFILVLDSLEDPHNVGSLLRSAEAAGVHGVLYPTHRQAPLSPSAVKASAGAIEHLLLCPVDDLPGALSDLHIRGIRVAGADGDAPLTARQSDLRGPLAIVVGSEGQGLGPAIRRRCDLFMRIPMRGHVGSLNAAVAGSILLFEAVAQRDPAIQEATADLGAPETAATPDPATADDAAIDSQLTTVAKPTGMAKPKGAAKPRGKATSKGKATSDVDSRLQHEPIVKSASIPKIRAASPTIVAPESDPDPTGAALAEPAPTTTVKPTTSRRSTKATKTTPSTKATKATKATKGTKAGPAAKIADDDDLLPDGGARPSSTPRPARSTRPRKSTAEDDAPDGHA